MTAGLRMIIILLTSLKYISSEHILEKKKKSCDHCNNPREVQQSKKKEKKREKLEWAWTLKLLN